MSYRAAICDDSTTDAEFVGSILHQWAAERGIEVESERFASADAFLFRYAEDKSFDLLLLDVEMPGTDGVTLAKTVRQENEAVQIVFITGYSDYIAEGYDVAALHYLVKPVSREKLFAVFLGVGDVNQPYRGFADKALPGEEVAQVGGADLFEAVFRGVGEPCSVAAEDVDFKILPVLGRGDGPFSVGAVHAVRGPEQIAEQFVGKRLGGERAVCRPSAERLHERLSPLGIGRGECKGGGGLRRAHHEEETGGQYRNEPFRHSVDSLEEAGLGGMASVRRKDAGYHGVVTDWKYA